MARWKSTGRDRRTPGSCTATATDDWCSWLGIAPGPAAPSMVRSAIRVRSMCSPTAPSGSAERPMTTTPWTAADLPPLDDDPSSRTEVLHDRPPRLLPDVDFWDLWPVRGPDGEVAAVCD